MTRKERRRIEEKGKRGVCRIQKHCAGNQGYETVASGSVIKHHIDRRWKSKYLIVTACNVFQGDFNVRNYRVDFMKSTSKLKTFQLNDAVVVGGEILHTASGLAVIPLDSHSSVFRHGLFRKKCGILKHYSFEVESFQNANTQDSAFSNELCCHMVADHSTSNLFGVKPHELTRNSTSGQCVLSNCNFNQSTHFPLGAAILRRVRNKWSTTGVLSSCSADGTCRPVWLSQENLSLKNLRTGTYTGANVYIIVNLLALSIFTDRSNRNFRNSVHLWTINTTCTWMSMLSSINLICYLHTKLKKDTFIIPRGVIST